MTAEVYLAFFSVLAQTFHERIIINEKTMWSGGVENPNRDCYQVFGDMLINWKHAGATAGIAEMLLVKFPPVKCWTQACRSNMKIVETRAFPFHCLRALLLLKMAYRLFK